MTVDNSSREYLILSINEEYSIIISSDSGGDIINCRD